MFMVNKSSGGNKIAKGEARKLCRIRWPVISVRCNHWLF